MSTLGVHGQDEVHIAGVRRSSLVPEQSHHLPLDPVPSCSCSIARTEQVLNILDQVLSSACCVGAKIIISSILQEESGSVAVYSMGEGEEKISLLYFQHLTVDSWVDKVLKVY